nr:ubiquitin ligase subunit HrtA [Hymenolepis microstoma]
MLWRKKNTQQEGANANSAPANDGVPANNNKKNSAKSSENNTIPTLTERQTSNKTEKVHNLDIKKDDLNHFQIRKWDACAVWSWDVIHDTCVICRNAMMSPCIHCQAKVGINTPDEICAVAWGICNHAYHLHCINRWLESSPNSRCPLDNSEWEFSRVGQ